MPTSEKLNVKDHSPEAIARRMARGPKHSYLRDFVYGGIDGSVTTFAVVSGVVGASLSTKTVLILGVANLVADGFSMAASNYLGTRTEQEELKHYEAIERREIELVPDGEREEVRQILAGKGLRDSTLEQAVSEITADRNQWVRLMIAEEYGVATDIRSPFKAALSTLLAFITCGVVPLLPYLFARPERQVALSCGATGIAFFAIGSLKSIWSISSWWRSGALTLALGGASAALAYGAGLVLKSVGA